MSAGLGRVAWVVLALLALTAGLGVSKYIINRPPALVSNGQQYLDQTLSALNGQPATLRPIVGDKPVLVNFWATWCQPCREEMPLLNQYARQHDDIILVGIALDRVESVKAFIDSLQITYPQYISPHLDLASWDNKAAALPYTVLLATDGSIKQHKLGSFSEQELNNWIAQDE